MKTTSLETFTLQGKTCTLLRGGAAQSGALPLLCVLAGEEFLEQLPDFLKALPKDCPPFLLLSFGPNDWNRDYSPWPAPALSAKGEAFSGGGPQTLRFLTGSLLPYLWGKYAISENLLLGYSLGGLMAFWALCESERFAGCASCSGSLWYDGWLGYLEGHLPRPGSRVYLSLGKTEEKARNSQMAQVGDATRQSAALLEETPGVSTALQWREGGHFYQIPQRLAAGAAWLLSPAEQESFDRKANV